MKKENKYLQIYPFGYGVLSIDSGLITSSVVDSGLSVKIPLPYIDISMNNEQFSIGEDLKGRKLETEQRIKLVFRNIEGLEVLQEAIDLCREALVSESINRDV